jgi:hypothetical protein
MAEILIVWIRPYGGSRGHPCHPNHSPGWVTRPKPRWPGVKRGHWSGLRISGCPLRRDSLNGRSAQPCGTESFFPVADRSASDHCSSTEPAGTRRICLRPSSISNSSPGFRCLISTRCWQLGWLPLGWLPLRCCDLPALLTFLAPELEGPLPTELQPAFQERCLPVPASPPPLPVSPLHLGSRGRAVQKPRLMPLRTAQSVARQLQARHIGLVAVPVAHAEARMSLQALTWWLAVPALTVQRPAAR